MSRLRKIAASKEAIKNLILSRLSYSGIKIGTQTIDNPSFILMYQCNAQIPKLSEGDEEVIKELLKDRDVNNAIFSKEVVDDYF